MVSTTYCTTCTRTNNQAAIQDIIISNLNVKNTNSDVHIRVLKNVIKANGEIVKATSPTCLVLFLKTISLNEVKALFKTIQIAHLKVGACILQVI
jgi:hypothetical protein